MGKTKVYWEKFYDNDTPRFPDYDGWLDKYLSHLQNSKNIVDLGCGNGVNALYLHSQNIGVTACDFSENALKQLKNVIPECPTMCFDMSKEMPFVDETVDIMIADLAIHYFDWQTTKSIVEDIFRTLKKGGLFLCRVNSTKEYRPHKSDVVLEQNYYVNESNHKRFFDEKDTDELFLNHNVLYKAELVTEKYGSPKVAWEIALRK